MATPETDPTIGTRIREYEILDIIGRGGMGAVYKARHIYLDEERAIKLIRTGVSENSAFIKRFIREAKLLTRLRHPNLVQLYEFGTLDHEDTYFMVLELVRGESVLQRIKRNERISVEESVRIIRQAALGLELAHQKGVIHRDISPDNLLILDDEEKKDLVKVIDFGIAKPTIGETQRYTMENSFIGKLQYSSPEQCGFHEEGEVLDHRSDIYSLAVTLYHMLAGKLPFYAPSPQGYLVKHASEIPKPVSTHLPEGYVPQALDDLIMRALSKRREDRQSSMRELINDLDSVYAPKTSGATSILPAPTLSELKAGDLFANRYRVVGQIGKGGMGTVYRAADTMLNVTVALKVMNPALSDNPKALDRFKREVILARQVAHRNVCRIYDFGEYRGVHYVSMELLEGQTLADILRKEGPYTAESGIPILTQILYALQEAHSAGVVHRDLKPQNIIVDTKGRTTITDFGISTSESVTRLTQTGALMGTPRYMAPEQFAERSIDQRTDIYSIAIIMFEMFTGALPYEANTPASMMYAHLNAPPHRPSELVPDISPQLEKIILKGLEKDPERRYQDVDSLLEALQPFIKTTRRDASDSAWSKRADLSASGRHFEVSPFASSPAPAAAASATPSPEATPEPPDLSTSAPASTSAPPAPAAQISADLQQKSPGTEIGSMPTMFLGAPAVSNQPAITEESEQKRKAEPAPPLKVQQPLDQSMPIPAQSKRLPIPVIAGGSAALVLIILGIWFVSHRSNTSSQSSISEKSVSTSPQQDQNLVLESAERHRRKGDRALRKAAVAPSGGSSLQNVEIDTAPPAASIIVDGKDTGLKTPASIPLDPNKMHEVQLQLAGYEPLKHSVDQNPPANLLLQMKPLPGQIQYKGKVPVSIYSDKKLLFNASDGSSLSLPAGSYTLTLISTNKAYIKYVQTIEVKPQETTTIAGPETGSLSITANPSNCKIFIDGVFIDTPPIFDFALQTGDHQIRVAWEKQAKEKTITITVAAGQSKSLRATMDNETADVVEQSPN